MRILAIELIELELQLVELVRSGAGSHDLRPVSLVHLVGEGGEGYGECAALAEPTYTSESQTFARNVLCAELLPRLVAGGSSFSSSREALARLAPVRGHEMAKAAIEMALLDLELRGASRSLADWLGGTRRTVAAGATIGFGEVGVVVAAAGRALDAGYAKVKCKVAPGFDLASLDAVRSRYPELVVSADANGSYDLEQSGHLARLRELDRLGLAYLEQPLAPDDLLGHARLVAELETPVILDESVTSLGGLETAIALRALDGLSVKASRLGGLANARRVVERGRELGLHLLAGGMFESGIGRAAALALASLEGFDLVGDLGGSDRYFERDLAGPHRLIAGELVVPDGPGLGVAIDAEAIAQATTSVHRVPLSG